MANCPNCGSSDTWDDNLHWGCNRCPWSSLGGLNSTRTVSNPYDQHEVENRGRDYDRLHGISAQERAIRDEADYKRRRIEETRCQTCRGQMVPLNGAYGCPACHPEAVKRDGRYNYLYGRRH